MWGTWPWEAVVAVAGLAIPNLIALCRWTFRNLRDSDAQESRIHERGWERAATLEAEIIKLRVALHRAHLRSSVLLTISEMLMLAMRLSLDERIAAVKQARKIAEESLPDGEQS